MNIHYLERPFRCHSCSVSFRTKGHLQKHERSASHHNKLSSSPALSSSEPRPFKCVDCNIAFRIHGHLAKHLRSKMHIMKLECLAKIPFGLYAELERSNSLLTEINTADGDQCLESLKVRSLLLFFFAQKCGRRPWESHLSVRVNSDQDELILRLIDSWK
jgi:HIV type I enhancer-binding protein